MGAYNWIDVDMVCPACGQVATVRAQTHVASSYDGDHSGRFCDRVYKLDQRMAWWPGDHPDFRSWCEGAKQGQHPDEVFEACCSDCSVCHADLYTVIRFITLTPVQLADVGLEANWLSGYPQ